MNNHLFNEEIWGETLFRKVSDTHGYNYNPYYTPFEISLTKMEARMLAQEYLRRKIGQTTSHLDSWVLKSLRNELSQYFFHSHFIRISSTSPKDCYQLMNPELEIESVEDPQFWEKVEKQKKLLKVNNPNEALEVLTSSERVYKALCNFINGGIQVKLNILLYQWKDMDPKYEAKCFIFQKRLVAISPCYANLDETLLPRCLPRHLKILHYQVRKWIPYNNYVMNIYLDGDRPLITDINPYDFRSNCGLFNWDDDMNILFTSDHPPVFRSRKEKVD